MASGFVKKNLGFWGIVGGVMTALKLKERWDDCELLSVYSSLVIAELHVSTDRQVPGEDGSEGPVALHSPLLGNAELPEHMALDTEIPMARPTRKRSKDCCVCCGLKCGLFWKAFGIVCLITLGWQAVKLIMWLVKPSPTGLEGMPEFSNSLGCQDAPYFYKENENMYTIPVGPDGGHSIDLRNAGSVGTIHLIDAHPRVTEVGYQVTVRTDDKPLLDEILLHVPSADDIANGMESRFLLSTPSLQNIGSSCVRYDLLVFIPQSVKKFTLQTGSYGATQIRVMNEANIDMDKMTILMHGNDERNMLIPATGLRAKDLHLEITGGWLVGKASIVEKTTLSTQRGAAVSNVKLYPVPANEDESPATATLVTTTGRGRSDFFYIDEGKGPHRPISSIHQSSRNGDLYLTYKEAEFNGRISLDARSYTATGVHGNIKGNNGTLPWVGDADGGDMLEAKSNNGWVGLYF
ncbi:hypothetical protein EIP86_009085 [Pleurotus ostreatoroseus]|nr:hypothetical protein EIP86_009085 [Pleurotus ostreatoroseus]